MHRSVGVIIENKKGERLMIERKNLPFGWACPAGHIDEGESPEEAARREVKEEVGLALGDLELKAHEFIAWNECSQGVKGHDWFVFATSDYAGEIRIEKTEVKNYQWVDKAGLKELELEPVWSYWFDKLNK
ncbi:MAG TPA: NUDIX hydrolase [Candidatus Moranbacteria bacterium]|nr:NUDIX hydrolase [Candidatus Moranbacteria bacterium]